MIAIIHDLHVRDPAPIRKVATMSEATTLPQDFLGKTALITGARAASGCKSPQNWQVEVHALRLQLGSTTSWRRLSRSWGVPARPWAFGARQTTEHISSML
jgi:hypothetical protein